MTLELSGIRKAIVDILDGAGWTVDTLAVADVKSLTPLPRIGKHGAARIIKVARETANKRGLAESKRLLQTVQRIHRLAPVGVVKPVKPVEPPAESVRVRRIRESMETGDPK